MKNVVKKRIQKNVVKKRIQKNVVKIRKMTITDPRGRTIFDLGFREFNKHLINYASDAPKPTKG